MISSIALTVGFVLGLGAQPFGFNVLGLILIALVVFTSKEFREV